MSYQALLFCPDEKTARVVTQVLTELDFSVEPCNEPFAAVKKLMAQHFDAVVVDSDNEQNATLLFKSARNSSTNHSSLAVAVVEGQAGVAKAFRIGANLVLTKPINVEQSKGTLRVARGLLRKGAEATKSTTPAMTVSPTPAASHLTQSASTPKPTFASVAAAKPQPPTEISAPPASQLEVEKEPEPRPEPAEAAFLESIPDPAARTGPSAPSETSREFPWQPVAKPLAEPMASALRRAAEAAGKQHETEPPSAAKPLWDSPGTTPVKESDTRPFAKDAAWGPGAAAAPAPAKEKVHFEATAAVSAPAEVGDKIGAASADTGTDAPSFSSLDDQSREGTSAGGKKTLTIVAAGLLLVAATAYFGWTKLQLGSGSPAVLQKPTAASRTGVSVSAPVPATSSTNVTSPSTIGMPQDTGADSLPSTATADVAAPSKPSAALAKETDLAGSSNSKPVSSKTPEPVVVRSENPKPLQSKAPTEEPVAAPELESLGTGSTSQAISGIVTSTTVNVPKQAPQMLKVSQGVSQGLLLKKVQPVYPAQALQLRMQGAVQLQAVISRQGSISNVKVLSGDTMLARAAVDAVRQWRYKPYYLNNEPVEIQTQITVNFKLP